MASYDVIFIGGGPAGYVGAIRKGNFLAAYLYQHAG